MLKFLLICLAFTTPAFAQSFDLGSLPPDYSFVSQSENSQTTVSLLRRDGARFLFEERTAYADGSIEAVKEWINMQSQTVSFGETGVETRFSPHDCAPSMGTCYFTWISSEDSFKMKSVTKLVGDIQVSSTYFKDGDTWVFWTRDCTTYDEYGFWVDFVRIYNDDETQSGARVRAGPDRLDELWKICVPPKLTS